ncbi:MAG: GNAT family N-acetyltransferase [Deltaproteobacteria bacterium]|jgi:RimJ/RimL family protein N-acetyltransferase|nr:GNAT family N-acetyltransferase [Deltaproteobacteria bacterium]
MTEERGGGVTSGFLTGKLVKLREYRESDAEKVCEYMNDLEVRKFVAIRYYPFLCSLEEVREWIRQQKSDFANGSYAFAIDAISAVNTNETSVYIGGCGINNFNSFSRVASIWISIANKNYWGMGYGTEALQLLLRFIFLQMNVQKVGLGVNDDNERAIAFYKKNGFQEEGRLRRNYFQSGSYHDTIIMGLLVEEWQEKFGAKLF